MAFYLAGLIVILLLKTFVHNRSDDRVEWIRRGLELPADASILSLMAVVAASTASSEPNDEFGLWILAEIVCVLVSIVLFKYGSKNVSDQSGQLQFDHTGLFIFAFVGNAVIAFGSIWIVWQLGIF